MTKKPPILDRYDHNERENYWISKWEESGIYRWNKDAPRDNTFVVDTPPPTVSGSLHLGHVFSFTQTDVIVRYQRMKGMNIFYPIGWDDNGLATERRVQNYFGIKCDPSVLYDPNWKPNPMGDSKRPVQHVSRKNFIDACGILTAEDEATFEELFRKLALSIDWSLQYATIDQHCRKISQLSFLDLVDKGLAYNSEAPTVWDVDFQTAIAQAEIEDRDVSGFYHDIKFSVEGGEDFVISTTRPELLPACIAVVAHPEDTRYHHLFGKTAITPLFKAPVPILPATHADPEKGTGILMVCTFGDMMDVEWWKQSKLPPKQIIGADGRLIEVDFTTHPFISKDPKEANANYSSLVRLPVKKAREKIAELLKEGSFLTKDPSPTLHQVRFYEKGDRPLEYLTTRQWFIKLLDHKDAFIEQGKKIRWHPEHMYFRYEHWVNGLNQDWCISRQRYFGVPFPVWYPVLDNGALDYNNPIYASAEMLPIDPQSDTPSGFSEEQRGVPGGFIGDPDVMDTWATSSMTPQIESHWGIDNKRHNSLFPMDLRPQAHEIIRTWAFYTIVKAWMHEKKIPWHHVAISGWVLDPDRKKMSKSKGNVVTPKHLLEEYSTDSVRYWASRARLGADTATDEAVFKIGRKLTTKLFNASKFVLMQIDRTGTDPAKIDVGNIVEPLDVAMVSKLREVIKSATERFERFDYASSLQLTEDAFWNYCDNYLELVKVRSYSEADTPARRSAVATLGWSLKTFLRLFAPVLPYITEEIWSWAFADADKATSIHTYSWPSTDEVNMVPNVSENDRSLRAAFEVTGKIRSAKTMAQRSLKWPVAKLNIRELISGAAQELEPVLPDVLQAGNVNPDDVDITKAPADTQTTDSSEMFEVTVHLADKT